MFICITLVLLGAFFYIENVLMGSATAVHDCEIGAASCLAQANTMSRQEFFGRFLPFVLFCLGIPLALHHPVAGLVLVLAAGLLYFGNKIWISVTSP